MPAVDLTGVMLLKRADPLARRALESAQPIVSELVVVINDDADPDTRVFAADRADRVIARPWTGFADGLNAGISAASRSWILRIDSDELFSAHAPAMIAAATKDDDTLSYAQPRYNYGFGYSVTFALHTRLFRNLPWLRYRLDVWEQLIPDGGYRGYTCRLLPVLLHHMGHQRPDVIDKHRFLIDYFRTYLSAAGALIDGASDYAAAASRWMIASNLTACGDLDEAFREALVGASTANPYWRAHFLALMGDLLLAEGDEAGAASAFNRGLDIQRSPSRARCLNGIGMVQLRKGALDDAATTFTRAHEEFPYLWHIAANLAVTRETQGHMTAARWLAKCAQSLNLELPELETTPRTDCPAFHISHLADRYRGVAAIGQGE